MEKIELRFNPVHRIRDSFDTLSQVQNASETSFISLSYQEESKPPRNPASTSKPLRQANRLVRPLSILKTTFLEDDSLNYDLPKRLTPDNSRFRDFQEPSLSGRPSQKYENSFRNVKILNESQEKDNQNELMKKDALIETLRTRIVKMVEELEETHRKINSNKNNIVDELKIIDLQARCEDLEGRLQSAIVKEKELNQCLDKKDEEIGLLTKELRAQRLDFDGKSESIKKLESELEHFKQKSDHFQALVENFKVKVENSMKAVEISNDHKNHLEQEIVRLEIFKRNHENEISLAIKESKNFESLKKTLEDKEEEAKKFQRLLKDAEFNYENLKQNNSNLLKKLQYLEDQLRSIDLSIRTPLREKQERSNSSNNLIKQDRENLSQKTCENCLKNNKKFRNISSSQEIVQEIMTLLNLTHSFEIIPSIKKNFQNAKEKKLIKKIVALLKDCLNKTHELSCGQIWRIIKRVFEDYAKLVQDPQNNELQMIRKYFGEGNLMEKISSVVQENKHMKEIVSIVKKKLRLTGSASFYDVELAVSSMSVL
jgi:hypothetical protein